MTIEGLPLFPVTVVGSWPRTPDLLEALRQRQAGRLSWEDYNKVADEAVLECLKYQDDAGVDIVSDGEQRRDNFYSFVEEKMDGVKLMSLAELMDHVEDKTAFDEQLRSLDAPAFAIHNATVVGKISRRQSLAMDEVEFLRKHTSKPIKIALPGPYLLTRSMWVKGVSDSVYPTLESLADDIVKVLREELIEMQEAGVEFVQLDEPVLSNVLFKPDVQERTFMCASMAASSGDPTREMVWALRLMNTVVRDIKGMHLGVHVCRGNWSRKEDSLLNGTYEPMLTYLTSMQLDQLVLEYATPRAGELAAFEKYAKKREIGLGVVNPRSDDLESPRDVVERVNEALKYFEPTQIYLNPDCGFGTFAERPMNSAEMAFKKLQIITEAAKELRTTYS